MQQLKGHGSANLKRNDAANISSGANNREQQQRRSSSNGTSNNNHHSKNNTFRLRLKSLPSSLNRNRIACACLSAASLQATEA
jgi:hypothetical protein